MNTILTTLCTAALSLGITASPALAGPGDANDGDESRVELLDGTQSGCAVQGAMCVTAGRMTVAAPSAASAALGLHPAAGAAPRFSRDKGGDDETPWTLNLSANLHHHALAGNAVFLVYDADNGKALANHEVIGAYQTNIPAGEQLAARLTLSPKDGFHPGHTYRIRVLQIVHGKEVVLTDGPVWLW